MSQWVSEVLWKQFGGSIDMLARAVAAWPDNQWSSKKFYYMAYHTAVFLDYYLTVPPKNFSSPLPYTLTEHAEIPSEVIDDVVPDRLYSKAELLSYIQESRFKCKRVISNLTDEQLQAPWIDKSDDLDLTLSGRDALKYSVFEILLYNMRHVQHHAAQMNLMLRQQTGAAPDYVSHAGDGLI